MKKIFIILGLIGWLTELTAAEKISVKSFEALLAAITPKITTFPGLKNAYQHPLVPSFLKSEEITETLTKYKSPEASLASHLGKISLIISLLIAAKTDLNKMSLAFFLTSFTTLDQGRMALTISPAIAAYYAYRFYYPTLSGVYASPVATNTPITGLALTITLQKNGWFKPLTFNINTATDANGYQAFLAQLQRDLTDQEKATTGDNAMGNVALLQHDQTYTFLISGTVTYQNGQQYQLKQERIIENKQDDNQNEWIELFWKKNIATRIASVWQNFPENLINDRTATYHALVSDTATNTILYSVYAYGKEPFKDLFIEKLADEILPTTQKQIEIKFSVTQGKHHFRLTPFNIAINAPQSEPAIYNDLQRSLLDPRFRVAQRAYALQLWNMSGEPALANIAAAAPITRREQIKTTIVWASTTLAATVLLDKLNKSNILSTVACTGLGIATFSSLHALYRAHKEVYH